MGLLARRVPENWQHPTTDKGYIPLKDNYILALEKWTISSQEQSQPEAKEYMPNWSENQRTHWQMYEETNGLPVSPVMKTAKELATWLANELWKTEGWKLYQIPLDGWMTVLTHKEPVEVIVTTCQIEAMMIIRK